MAKLMPLQHPLPSHLVSQHTHISSPYVVFIYSDIQVTSTLFLCRMALASVTRTFASLNLVVISHLALPDWMQLPPS